MCSIWSSTSGPSTRSSQAEAGGEPAGREVGGVVGPAGAAGGEQRDLVARQRQRAGHHRPRRRRGCRARGGRGRAAGARASSSRHRRRARAARSVPASRNSAVSPVGWKAPPCAAARPPNSVNGRSSVLLRTRNGSRSAGCRCAATTSASTSRASRSRPGGERPGPVGRAGAERRRGGQDVAAAAAAKKVVEPRLDRGASQSNSRASASAWSAGSADARQRLAAARLSVCHPGQTWREITTYACVLQTNFAISRRRD